jgi:hypothetical protein
MYEYMDRTARPECAKVRELIEEWLSSVPEPERDEFIRRFQSCDDIAFHSAFLELYAHSLLRATHHSVEFHPRLAGTTKRPDFLAKGVDGRELIVECTVATEESAADRAAQARKNVLYDSINRVVCDDVFLDLRIEGSPNSPVPGRKWITIIQNWVNSLNYNALVKLGPLPNDAEKPRLELEHDGLYLTIKPIPKKSSARGKGQPSIGAQSFDAYWVDSHADIRETIRDKASRYGSMSRPYIVVVNCLGTNADEEEINGAIFGHAGLWHDIENPTNKRVSAVVAIEQLLPWSVSRASARFFNNPNATFPYSGALSILPQTTHNSKIDGIPAGRILGLDPIWPQV